MPTFEVLGKTKDFWQPLMGFINEQGTVTIEPQFLQSLRGLGQHLSEAGYAIVQRPGAEQHIVIDVNGETVFTFPKNHRPTFSQTPPDENGIFGVVHQVDAENTDLWNVEGRDRVFHGETRYHAMRLDGSIAFDACLRGTIRGKYLFAASSRMNEKEGLMNHEGQVIIPPVYDSIYPSRTDPYVTVIKDGAANVLTLEGLPVFSRGFDVKSTTNLKYVEDGLWVVANYEKNRADVFDVASTEKIGHLPLTYWSPTFPNGCPTLSGGVACINHPQKGSSYFYPDGSPVMPGILGRPRWFNREMRTGYFHDGRASFKLGEVWGYLDLSGKHVIPPQFRSDIPFRDGLARVKYPADGNSWDRYSYVDRNGAVIWHQED